MYRKFGLRYSFFSEHHCQAKKAGVTVKQPLRLTSKNGEGEEIEELRHLVTIRLRLRIHPTKGDPQKTFISRGTQMAVLLHELCHLKHMNHGKGFMLFLREIFAHAKTLGLFDPQELSNEIPSPWPWENVIFRTGGEVAEEELLRLFAEHVAAQEAKKAQAAASEGAPAAAAAAAAADAGPEGPARESPADAGAPMPPPPPPAADARARSPPADARKASAVALLSLVKDFGSGAAAAACADGCGDPSCLEAAEIHMMYEYKYRHINK